MKQRFMTLLSVLVIGTAAPIVAAAETLDSKLNDATTKIETLKNEKAAAEATLVKINTEVANLEVQVEDTLNKKIALEKELNQLATEIAALELAIEKRTDKITEQVRSAQINQGNNRFLNVVLESDSLSDAITRSWAYGKLVTANNDIVTAQKEDQEELAKNKISLDEKLVEINHITETLKVKQTEMIAKQYDQAILTKEVEANLTTEETKKAGLLKEKKQAEERKVEAARLEAEAAKAIAAENSVKKNDLSVAKEINNINVQEMPGEGSSKPGSGSKPQTGKGDFQWPLPSISITSGYGGRVDPTGNAGNYHSGLDMAGSANANIFASRAGTVVSASYEGGGGNHVIIQHDNGYYTYYLHLNSQTVSTGQQVNAGDVVGLMGSTGDSTGVHLHFGISTGFWSGYLDPGPFLGLY